MKKRVELHLNRWQLFCRRWMESSKYLSVSHLPYQKPTLLKFRLQRNPTQLLDYHNLRNLHNLLALQNDLRLQKRINGLNIDTLREYIYTLTKAARVLGWEAGSETDQDALHAYATAMTAAANDIKEDSDTDAIEEDDHQDEEPDTITTQSINQIILSAPTSEAMVMYLCSTKTASRISDWKGVFRKHVTNRQLMEFQWNTTIRHMRVYSIRFTATPTQTPKAHRLRVNRFRL